MKSKLLLTIIWLTLFLGTNATGFASSVSLQWDPNSGADLAGYKLYFKANSSVLSFDGTSAKNGTASIDVQNRTTATVSGLDPGLTYYFAVTAYNSSGLESAYSNVIAETIPLPDTTAPDIASFAIPATSSSLTMPISTFIASDNVGITGYLVTDKESDAGKHRLLCVCSRPNSFGDQLLFLFKSWKCEQP